MKPEKGNEKQDSGNGLVETAERGQPGGAGAGECVPDAHGPSPVPGGGGPEARPGHAPRRPEGCARVRPAPPRQPWDRGAAGSEKRTRRPGSGGGDCPREGTHAQPRKRAPQSQSRRRPRPPLGDRFNAGSGHPINTGGKRRLWGVRADGPAGRCGRGRACLSQGPVGTSGPQARATAAQKTLTGAWRSPPPFPGRGKGRCAPKQPNTSLCVCRIVDAATDAVSPSPGGRQTRWRGANQSGGGARNGSVFSADGESALAPEEAGSAVLSMWDASLLSAHSLRRYDSCSHRVQTAGHTADCPAVTRMSMSLQLSTQHWESQPRHVRGVPSQPGIAQKPQISFKKKKNHSANM